MGLRKAYQSMIRAFNGGAPAMAGALGISEASLQNRIYEVKGQAIQTEMALAMQRLSGTTFFAEAIAEQSGGMFVSLPEVDDHCDNEELLAKFTQILSDLGELAKTHTAAIADGIVNDREKHDLEQVAAAAHRHIQELLTLTFRIYCPKGAVEK
jgi:hypothetical protein